METFTNLAKQTLWGWSNTLDNKSIGSTDTESNQQLETIDDEVIWFHDLNQFIQLLNKRLNSDTPNQWDEKLCSTMINKLLVPLNQMEDITKGYSFERSILEHWWVSIVNLLDNDMNSNSKKLLLVSFESISKIITQLIIFENSDIDQWETFHNNLIKTCHYLRRQLSFNNACMKQINEQARNQDTPTPPNSINQKLGNANKNQSRHPDINNNINNIPQTIKEENDEILEIVTSSHLLLGQVIAYSLIYLPDAMHFNTHFVSLITNDKYKIVNERKKRNKLYQWHKIKYKTTSIRQNHSNEVIINPGTPLLNRTRSHSISQDSQCFKILVSYLKNHKVFIAFYWHYWYINMQNIIKFNQMNKTEDQIILDMKNIDEILPYGKIIIKYSMYQLLKVDIFKYRKHTLIKTDKSNEIALKIINENDNDKDVSCIRRNIRNMSIWKCLIDLGNKYNFNQANIKDNWKFILGYHDKFQLQYFQQITAYEPNLSNLLFNHILSNIALTNYDKNDTKNDFLNWDDYSTRLIQLVKTLNFKNQINVLTFLFNHWLLFDKWVQDLIFDKLYPHLEMLIFNQFNMISITSIKLIVFKLSRTHGSLIGELFHRFSEEFKLLASHFNKVDPDDFINPMVFQMSKKFIMNMKFAPKRLPENQYTPSYDGNNGNKNNDSVNKRLFFRIINIRDGNGLGKSIMESKIKQFNLQWSLKKNSSNMNNGGGIKENSNSNLNLQKKLPLEPKFQQLNMSIFPKIEDENMDKKNTNTLIINKTMYHKYLLFVKKTNLTISEYYEYLNLENDEDILIEHV